MKQSKGLNGDLKPEQKKPTSLATDIDSQVSTFWNRLRRVPSCKQTYDFIASDNLF